MYGLDWKQTSVSFDDLERRSHSSSSPTGSSSSTPGGIDLSSVLNCFICLGNVENAHLCPNCGKLACYSCLRRWLSEHYSCPHCRTTLMLSQLVKATFMDDLSAEIDKLKHSAKKRSRHAKEEKMVSARGSSSSSTGQSARTEEECADHNLALIYYCETCNQSCCSDCCVLSGGIHHGHDLSKLSTIYDRHLTLITKCTAELELRKDGLLSAMHKVNENISLINRTKDLHHREMARQVHHMQERLTEEANKILFGLFSQKTMLMNAIKEYTTSINAIQRDVRQSSQSELVSQSGKVMDSVKDVQLSTSHLDLKDFRPVLPVFVNELVPSFDSAEFVISHYTRWTDASPRADNDEDPVLLSSVLEIGSLYWRLKVYPVGTGVSKDEFISVFLELVKGMQEPSPFEYRVEMVHVEDEERNVSREFSSTFSQSESWGYNRFFRIGDLERDGFINHANSDSVKFRYYVRFPTYRHKYIEEKRHTAKLETEIHVLETRVAALEGDDREALRLSTEAIKEESRVEMENPTTTVEVSDDQADVDNLAEDDGNDEQVEECDDSKAGEDDGQVVEEGVRQVQEFTCFVE